MNRPSPAPTPAPTPDPSAPCAAFDSCDICLKKVLHPTRDCHWCTEQKTCGEGLAALCSFGIVQGDPCPTISPTPLPTPRKRNVLALC